MRRAAIILSLLLAVVLAIGVGGVVWLNAADLAGPVARYAARKAGRSVTIASLRVQPGRWVGVQVQDLRLANVPGGSAPEMVTLKHAAAEIDLFSIIAGPMILRKLDVEGLRVLLERGAQGVGNWKLGDATAKPATPAPDDPGGRARFPTLLDATLHDGDITYRTGSGDNLRTQLASLAIHAEGSEQPVSLAGDGAYNGIAVTLRATTAPFAELHKPAVPLGMDLSLATPESRLTFKGSAIDPLNVDGLDGTLGLDTRKLAEVLAVFQLDASANLPLKFGGKLLRKGDLWRLLDAVGALSTAKFTGMLELTEGRRVQPKRVEPDRLSLELAFDRLDAGALMSQSGRGSGKPRSPDTLPTVERDPGVIGEARVSAKRVVYQGTEITDAAVRGAIMPGKVTLSDARFAVAGAKADLSVVMEPATPGTRISGIARLDGAEVGPLARMLGMARPPLDGRLSAHATAAMSGVALPDALKASRAAVVLSMNGGTVPRQLVEMASVDVRALFGGEKGSARITCLLAIADLHGLAGPVAPMRLVTSAGTIEGFGEIDLSRKSLDATIRSEPSTTSSVALDVPIRISGSFESPSVVPVAGTFDRARLLDASALRQLSPELQQSARAGPCLR